MAAKSGGKTIFAKSRQQTLQIPCGSKIWSKSLYLAVSEINMFLCLMQKFKMDAKSGGKTIFCKKSPVDSADILRIKNFRRNHSISLRYQDKRVFAFNAEIQDGRQKWQENDFCEKSPVDFADTLWVKNFIKIDLSRSVSEINVFLHFMAAKNGRKIIFAKSCQ